MLYRVTLTPATKMSCASSVLVIESLINSNFVQCFFFFLSEIKSQDILNCSMGRDKRVIK